MMRSGLIFKYGSVAAVGALAGGAVILFQGCEGCGGGRVYQWAETRGKARAIDLEAVERAMRESKDVTEFEEKVNQIYEGDELVLIEVKNISRDLQEVSGYADVNDNGEIDPGDEKLFTFRRWNRPDGGVDYAMIGYGPNYGYYHTGHLTEALLETWLLLQILNTPPYTTVPYYHTPPERVVIIKEKRDEFRRSPEYRRRTTARPGTATRRASAAASRARFATRPGTRMRATTAPKPITRSRWGSFRSSFFRPRGLRSFGGGFRGFGGFRGGGR
ncbi:hypothetical protein DRP77_03610 [Candidatus Poribacteria bacterium]|nr:MAG: hypothetical protein DRP77_03610 [Candidatus Poribacteria bacterium]